MHSGMIQFPRLPTVAGPWDAPMDKHLSAQPPLPRAKHALKPSRSTESLTQRKDRVEFLRRREWTRRAAAGGDQSSVPPVSISLVHAAAPRPPPVPCSHPDSATAYVNADASRTQRRARTYSWEDIVAAADAAASNFDYSPSGSPYVGRPDTIDETDEADEEPYIIYTATPRPPAQHASPLSLPASHAYPTFENTPGAVIYSTSPSSSPSPSPSPTLSPIPASTPVLVPTLGIGGPYFNHARRASLRGPHSRHSSLSSISEEDEGLARF